MTPFRFDAPPPPGPGLHEVTIPANLQSKTDLLKKLAVGLCFPSYFGHNWDALEECLGDLDWLNADRIVLIHSDLPPLAHESDRRVYLRILAQAARESEKLSIFFPASCRSELIDSFPEEL